MTDGEGGWTAGECGGRDADRLGNSAVCWTALFFMGRSGPFWEEVRMMKTLKKLAALPEEKFLKCFFGLLSLTFLVGAVCAPDRAAMLQGLWRIVSQPSKISTNYFYVGGYSATLLNMALVSAICLGLFVVFRGKPNNVSTLAVVLTAGFSAWGINIVNIWPTILGVAVYCLVKRVKLGSQVNAMLFSTGIAPLITELLVRYPQAEAVGFHLGGLLLALVVGLVIGFFLPAGMAFSPQVHKGLDLYSAALPLGMTAFLLNGLLYKSFGVELPAAPGADTLAVGSRLLVNSLCGGFFALCVLLALGMGARPRDYWRLLTDRSVANFSAGFGNGVFLLNVGVFGLFILGYYNLVCGNFNAIVLGIIFCMLSTCNSGSHPGNVWPILAGYALAAWVCGWISGAVGGTFTGTLGAQTICVGVCYANGLSPVVRKYGWQYGVLAGALHYLLVTTVPSLHGGYLLYNGGFTAALVCLLLAPQLEHFVKPRDLASQK